MPNIFEYHESDEVVLKLNDFSGPIELLHRLIVDGKYDIATFPLAPITKQYFEYMKQLPTINMDIASDFVEIAATLLEIKARSVLPKIVDETATGDEEMDPEALIRYRLMMYDMMKEQGKRLKEREQSGKFYREPKFSASDAILLLKSFDFDKMIDAYGQMMIRFGDKEDKMPIKKIVKDRFTVKDKIKFLANAIVEKKKFAFSDMFESDTTRGEVISTFQALLELMKDQLLTATQECFDSSIIIELAQEYEQNKTIFESLLARGEYLNE